MKKCLQLHALALACASAQVSAANDKLEEVIVTSSKIPMTLRSIGTSVSVMTGEEIEQLGGNALFQVLRTQPSVAVSNSGGPGKATSVRIRGEEGFRTLVLLDGIDISDASGTQVGPRFEHLLSSGIERVEILRGPQGLMYGADAGGVISVTTAAPGDALGGEVSAERGRYGTQEYSGNVGGSNETMQFILMGADYETDGFNARDTDDELRDDDGYKNTTLHGKLGWNLNEDLTLSLVGRTVSGKNEYDGCRSSHVCKNDYDMDAWRIQMDYDTGDLNHRLSYDGNDTDREFFTEGASTFKAAGTLDRYGYLGSYEYSEAFHLVYGAELEVQSLDDGDVDESRDQEGYYIEYQGGFNDNIFLTAGVRYDDNEDFGTHVSHRYSGAYLFAVGGGELKLRTTYGTGFRPPSLFELAYNSGDFASPPASTVDLNEEKSEGYDLGVSWFGSSGLYLEAVYFDQDVKDAISFDLSGSSGYLQDTGTSNSRGVELVADFPVSESLTLTGNYTYNETETAEGNQRRRRPEQLANLGISWRLLQDRLVLGMNVRGSYDAVDRRGDDLDDYTLVNLNASFELIQGLELYGRVENLFDDDYQEVPTYNTSGTAGYAGVRWTF